MRLDLYLSENGYAPSREKAKTMICDGVVHIGGKCITKPSYDVSGEVSVSIEGKVLSYVGRGGLKLEAALDAFSLSPDGMRCIDIGASTGGFTDCLLTRGAEHVYAVDAGFGQLAPSLMEDSRVTNMEHTNARTLTKAQFGGRPVDFAVCDVSFISLSYIFPVVTELLCDYRRENGAGSFVSLIKPQFEAGRDAIGKNGIVKNPKTHLAVVLRVISCAAEHGLYCVDCIPSPILGGDGNREFLAHFVAHTPALTNTNLTDKLYLSRHLSLS